MLRKHSYTETGRQQKPQSPASSECVTCNRLSNPLSDQGGLLQPRLWQNDDKLVAAVAGHRIRVAHGRENYRGHFHQHVRAHQMPVRIVDMLEIIQIEE